MYVFDPYSIALSKIERGFKTDIEDVAFMLRKRIIVLEQLAEMAEAMLPRARQFDLDAGQIRTNMQLLRKRKSKPCRFLRYFSIAPPPPDLRYTSARNDAGGGDVGLGS